MPHTHTPPQPDYNRSFAIGISLNIIFVLIELIYGTMAGSLALIADAWHNLSDVLGLLLAWGANYLASRKATEYRTYGFRRATIIASLTSSIFLLLALGGIAWEALNRLLSPQEVNSTIIIIVAAIGVVINTATALLFIRGQKHDLNIRAAYLHMAADAGVSFGVVIAGIAIMLTNWLWLDPVISLFVVVIILISTWDLFKDSINLSIDAVPKNIDITGIKNYLLNLDNVYAMHDLHVWALSTTEVALTVHIETSETLIDNNYLHNIQQHLKTHYKIDHATIQIENNCSENVCLLNKKRG